MVRRGTEWQTSRVTAPAAVPCRSVRRFERAIARQRLAWWCAQDVVPVLTLVYLYPCAHAVSRPSLAVGSKRRATPHHSRR